MMSALGALRRVMKLKLKKKTTAKESKKASTPKGPVDEPGSEKLKEAYLVMKHVQGMTMGDKLKNLVTAIVGNLGKLAKKKCTLKDTDSANSGKSALASSKYALNLLEEVPGSLITGKDAGCFKNAKHSLNVFIKKLSPG